MHCFLYFCSVLIHGGTIVLGHQLLQLLWCSVVIVQNDSTNKDRSLDRTFPKLVPCKLLCHFTHPTTGWSFQSVILLMEPHCFYRVSHIWPRSSEAEGILQDPACLYNHSPQASHVLPELQIPFGCSSWAGSLLVPPWMALPLDASYLPTQNPVAS